jgi:ABC-type branched-subunit amino acid transport system substrate-binding protein
VYGRGVLCREFRDAAATAAEGHFFVDMYLRSDRAPAEEQALRQQLAARDPGLVATASHAFGWDEMRLLAAAWWAGGSNVEKQIAFLEGLRGYQGAGGPLTFAERDHQGRWTQDPTTITRLSGGQFVVISTLDR